MSSRNYNYHNPNSKPGEDKTDGCCTLSCLKFSLYLYNLISMASGLTVLAISLWIIIDRDQIVAPYSNTYTLLAYIGLGLGAFIVFTTLIGCCGISRESHLLMFVYGTLCALMIIIEISGGLAAYVYRHDVHHELVSVLNKTITEQYGINNSTTAAIDTLQKGLHCCGAQSFEDWSITVWSTSGVRGSNQVPDSCCKTVSRLCGVRDHPSNIYYTGCGESLGSLASTHLLLLGSVALTVALIQIFGVVFSCKLGKTMKNLED